MRKRVRNVRVIDHHHWATAAGGAGLHGVGPRRTGANRRRLAGNRKNIEHGVFNPNAETLGRLLEALAAHNVQLVNLDLVPGCVISGVLHVAPRGKK